MNLKNVVSNNTKRENYNMKKFQKYLFCNSFNFILNKLYAANDNIYEKIDLFSEVLDKINKEYVDDVNQSKTIDAAINGVLQSLDPYSSYMSPELFNEMQLKLVENLEDLVLK